MTVYSDIGYSYISKWAMEENYFFGRVQIKACFDVVWTLTPAGFAQQEHGSYSNVWIVIYNSYTVPAEFRWNCISSSWVK